MNAAASPQIAIKANPKLARKRATSEEEQTVRRDLAALYRLVAHMGWDDLLATHISARVPGEHAFLVNPFGLLFEEVTASSLVKIDHEGNIREPTDYAVNTAGFVIHSAVHMARDDAFCVLHLHTKDGVAVSATTEGLLRLNQTSSLIGSKIAYHDYEGVAVDEGERARIAQDLGTSKLMFLRNHGTLSIGASVPEAFLQAYMLEWACTVQVKTLSMGRPLHAIDDAVLAKTEQMFSPSRNETRARYAKEMVWPAMLRKLARVNPGYDE